MPMLLRISSVAVLLLVGSLSGQTVPLGTMPSWTTFEQNIYSTGMIWRDCNNDGVIDVFFSNGNDIVQAANSIYLFGDRQTPALAAWHSSNLEYSGHCAVGDINEDGFADLVVSNYLGIGFGYPNRSNLYLNLGGLPDPAPAWNTPHEIFSFSCALGDVDNDGDLDLAFATGDGYYQDYQPDLIYLNDNGSFDNTVFWSSAASTAALDVAWGDVDRDGDLDLAFTYDQTATSVYYNDAGVLETTPSWQAGTIESGNTLVFGDIDGDDWLDLIVAYNNQLNGQGRFRVYFNDGVGNLDPDYGWQSHNGGYGSAIAVCDYDNDGDNDLAFGRWFHPLWMYENVGGEPWPEPVWSPDIAIVAEELAWVDIDAGGVLPMADTFAVDDGDRLFYTRHQPLYALDSVSVDGNALGQAGYCYDLVSGWVSLAQSPISELICYYRYSFHNDLAVSNWDTVNMVFANTNPPFVDMSADNTFGPVPLEVQFTDCSAEAQEWNWDFGDGGISHDQNPLHVYHDPGYYDVELSVVTTEREYTRSFGGIVSAHADTLRLVDARLISHSARVDVYARNFLPLMELTIPFGWDGPFDLRYDSMSVAGLRTAYFDNAALVSVVPAWKVATVYLAVGSQPPLEPGYGAVLSLYFTDLGSASGGSSPIEFTNYVGHELAFLTYAGVYSPVAVAGWAMPTACWGTSRPSVISP